MDKTEAIALYEAAIEAINTRRTYYQAQITRAKLELAELEAQEKGINERHVEYLKGFNSALSTDDSGQTTSD